MKPRNFILDENNEPVALGDSPADQIIWGQWFDNMTNRIVGYTDINSTVYVSTVFLGIDHNHWGWGGDDDTPILFETAVFSNNERDVDVVARYRTWDEAKAGHEEVVREQREQAGQRITVKGIC